MRGTSGSLFSHVDLEARIPARHPMRRIRQVVKGTLASLDAEFAALYTGFGRPSIPPERLIRASLIQILFSVRSERQLREQMEYNLLFRWFVGLGIDDPASVPTVFTKSRDRLLTTDMSRKVMAAILAHREVAPLLSDDHVPVDGTLVKAWASMKGFRPKADDTPPDDDPAARPDPTPPPRTTPNRPLPSPPRCPAPPAKAAMQTSTSGVRSGRTPPMPRRPTPTRGSAGNPPAPAQCRASRAMP
jgi:transposase